MERKKSHIQIKKQRKSKKLYKYTYPFFNFSRILSFLTILLLTLSIRTTWIQSVSHLSTASLARPCLSLSATCPAGMRRLVPQAEPAVALSVFVDLVVVLAASVLLPCTSTLRTIQLPLLPPLRPPAAGCSPAPGSRESWRAAGYCGLCILDLVNANHIRLWSAMSLSF